MALCPTAPTNGKPIVTIAISCPCHQLVRGNSDTKRLEEVDRLHPGALAGWGCDRRCPPHRSPRSGMLRLPARREVRGSGWREVEKSRGKLQPSFLYHCNDLLQASHPPSLRKPACCQLPAGSSTHWKNRQHPWAGPSQSPWEASNRACN